MGLRVSTNVASMAIQRNLSNTSKDLENSMRELASGSRFAVSGKNSAERSITEQMRSQISGVRVGTFNAENAMSFVQVAEGGLNEQNTILNRMRELAIQSASDVYGEDERKMMDAEYKQLTEEVERIAQSTTFGKQKLLAGDEREYEFQIGAYNGKENVLKYNLNANTTASNLDIDGSNVTDKSDAREAIDKIDKAMMTVSQARSGLGAFMGRLDSVVSHGKVMEEKLTEANSKMADADIAKSVSDQKRNEILQAYQLQALSQSNQSAQSLLRLIA